MNFVYLPGLDGTRPLREHLADRATIVSYPPDRVLAFDEYVAIASEHVSDDSIVIGESFSGPVAIRIASERRVAGVVLVCSFVKAPFPRIFAYAPRVDPVMAFWMVGMNGAARKALRDALDAVEPRVIRSRLRIALSVDERASLAKTSAPLLDLRATHDFLRHPRRAIVNIRRDAATAEIDGPHGLLLARPDETWNVIARWSATIPASRRPSATVQ
jgi:hypothetical protein